MCDGEEFNIYDGHTAKITVSEKAVHTRWQCPHTSLWSIPLQSQVTNLNLHTLLLNGTTGQESLNYLYNVPSSAVVLEHIELYNNDPAKQPTVEAIHNVYEIHSIEKTIQYLPAVAWRYCIVFSILN